MPGLAGQLQLRRRGRRRGHYLAAPVKPTAVFAASDEIAIGFIKGVRDEGVRVPDDVSVGGFDDIEYSGVFEPALTTMHQPRVELGRLSAANLVERMTRGTPSGAPRRTRIPCKLMIRDSVRPPADRAPRRDPGALSGTASRDRREEASPG